MNQEPQSVLESKGVILSMGWWIYTWDRLKHDRMPDSKKAAYKQCYGNGVVGNNVMVAASEFYLWYNAN